MMKTIRSAFSILLLGIIIFLQNACSSQSAVEPTITTITYTESLVPPTQTPVSAPTSTPTLLASLTPIPPTSTQEARYSTAVTIRKTENAITQQALNERETQIAEFSIDCGDRGLHSGKISPDGNWFAASCGYKGGQTLIVQNKSGTKWVLDFKDFLSPEITEEIMGAFDPIFWSPEGNYLFFIVELGYDGGGNYCFPRDRGAYGLFRLNVKTGSRATLISSTNSFPGYEIKFSPTGRRYAVTLDGVTITDLQTGKSTNLMTKGTIERLSWSPDGTRLAYSLANCDDEKIISSSMYLWDATTNQAQMLFEMDGMILRPESWIDSSALRISGEEIINFNSEYTIFEYSVQTRDLLFTGTATPRP